MSRSGRTGHDEKLAAQLAAEEADELWERWNRATAEGTTTLPWKAWRDKQLQYKRARAAAGANMDPVAAYSGWS